MERVQVLGEGELDIVFVPGVISHLDLLWEDAATSGFYRRLSRQDQEQRGFGLATVPKGVGVRRRAGASELL